MVIRECVWDVCVYISCTGDEGQLGSSKLLLHMLRSATNIKVMQT